MSSLTLPHWAEGGQPAPVSAKKRKEGCPRLSVHSAHTCPVLGKFEKEESLKWGSLKARQFSFFYSLFSSLCLCTISIPVCSSSWRSCFITSRAGTQDLTMQLLPPSHYPSLISFLSNGKDINLVSPEVKRFVQVAT